MLGGRWLTSLMNRIDPAFPRPFSPAGCAKDGRTGRGLVAIDGNTSRRSHDRDRDQASRGRLSFRRQSQSADLARRHLDVLRRPEAPTTDIDVDRDKGHGRIEQRIVTAAREIDWLSGDRRFPGELRLLAVATIIKVQSRAELKDRSRFETRYCISSAKLNAKQAAEAVRGHWGIENRLHGVLDVVFNEDQSRPRKGHGAKNMAIVRHFSIKLVRAANDKCGIKLRRKLTGWDPEYLDALLNPSPR